MINLFDPPKPYADPLLHLTDIFSYILKNSVFLGSVGVEILGDGFCPPPPPPERVIHRPLQTRGNAAFSQYM